MAREHNGFSLSSTGGQIFPSDEDKTSSASGVAASLNVLTTGITTDGTGNLSMITITDTAANYLMKIFVVKSKANAGDTVKIVPAHTDYFASITFNAVGQGCILICHGSRWLIVANNGGTIA